MTKKILVGLVLLAAGSLGCAKPSQNRLAAARVNGKDILRTDVDKYFNFRMQESSQKSGGDAEKLAKMEVLHDLIEREIMTQKAEQLKLGPKDSEVDAQIQELRGAATPEQFKKDLERRGFSEQDMRNEVRRTLTVKKLVEDQVNSKVQVSEAEVSRFYEDNRETFNVKEQQYRLGQIVVTANPNVAVTNLRNDKALNKDQAAAKIQRLASQAQGGGNFQQLASEYSEDPQSARTGGDLGYQPVSSLERLGPALKQAILKMNVGEITPVIQTEDSYWILKLLGKREPGQRSLQDPEVAEGIRAELRNRKQQLLTAAFSEQLQNASRVENYLAQETLAEFQKSK
jgi:peptidyl-prolyl cis-trans isomerase SurA